MNDARGGSGEIDDGFGEEGVDAGLEIEAWGIVSVPFVDGELASASRANGDVVGATMAYWSFTEWCQYLVGRR